MKNILKKFGVIGLTLAVLAPFIELPKVNAADCANHLQNYMFLDSNRIYFHTENEDSEDYNADYAGKSIFEIYSDGYQTYTHFPYAFLNQSGYKITVTATDKNTFNDSNKSAELTQYWEYFNSAKDTLSSYKDTNKKGDIFIQDTSTQFSKNYVDNTILLHGVWSSVDGNGYPILSKWQAVSGGKDYTIQNVLSSTDLANFEVEIKAAQFYDNKFQGTTTSIEPNYLQSVVDNGTNLWEDGSGNDYIPMSITRKINLSDSEIEEMLNDYIFGYETDDNKIRIYTTNTTIEDVSEAVDSYTAYKESQLDGKTYYVEKTTTEWDLDDADFDLGHVYYWPVILNVEYTSCPQTTGKWIVQYDDNVDDTSVNNLPSPQTENLGTNIKVSSTTPSRNGYVFKGWCEKGNDNCSNPYESGDTIISPTTSQTITLLAQWAPSGTSKNPGTGVASYIIGFAAVGVFAGGIYLVSKKKNLFKQI